MATKRRRRMIRKGMGNETMKEVTNREKEGKKEGKKIRKKERKKEREKERKKEGRRGK
tara:strand:+ start:125 stop:298 length:174 start_codon:yes stop_codon:yes gene_type:complete